MLRTLPDRTAFWIGLFLAYAGVAAAIRLASIETLGGDDAESFLWSRDLAWGYGVQPPLYAWLHWAMNRLFGETVAASVAMRALCHVGIYAGAFTLARRFAPVRIAGLAALGVFLVPEISQTFLRTRTHNMLATALAPLVVLAFLGMVDRRRDRDFAVFGAVAALGILAKATVAVLPVALILAALTDRSTRAALRPRGLSITLVVAALLLAGPASWLWANLDLGTASLSKFEATGDRAQGLLRLARSMIDSWGPVAALALVAFVATRRGDAAPVPNADLIWRAAGIAVALLIAGLVASGASEVKERWLVPILIPVVPILLVVLMQRRGPLRFLPPAVGGAYALAMLAALPAYHRDRPRPPMAPYVALAASLETIPADLILAPGDVAANVAINKASLPIRRRVDSESVACRGTVMLVAEVPEPVDSARLTARVSPCTVTPQTTRRIGTVPGGPVYDIEVLALAPPG